MSLSVYSSDEHNRRAVVVVSSLSYVPATCNVYLRDGPNEASVRAATLTQEVADQTAWPFLTSSQCTDTGQPVLAVFNLPSRFYGIFVIMITNENDDDVDDDDGNNDDNKHDDDDVDDDYDDDDDDDGDDDDDDDNKKKTKEKETTKKEKMMMKKKNGLGCLTPQQNAKCISETDLPRQHEHAATLRHK